MIKVICGKNLENNKNTEVKLKMRLREAKHVDMHALVSRGSFKKLVFTFLGKLEV